ncbi:MAG: nitrile hydratase accessory protein [Pseudomonadota bacterium]|nr:nitrile hydratase accessory protein [Pseudomonadota bacterium]
MVEPVRNAVFDEPWQAQLFAITVKLSEAGHFSWPEWTEHFGTVQKAAAKASAPDDGSAYYDSWLQALESLILERGLADTDTLAYQKQAWIEAYLHTPHGEPVEVSLPEEHD